MASEVRFNWMPELFENFSLGSDPDLDAVSWASVASDLGTRNLLVDPRLILAATRWFDAGKLDYALHGGRVVICLSDDPREYGVITGLPKMVGRDVLIVAPRTTLSQIKNRYDTMFDAIRELPSIMLRHAGQPAMLIPIYLAHNLRILS